MIWFKFKCHHRSLSFLCWSLFSSKCSEAEVWGTAVTDSVGWHFAECPNKTSLWVWLYCFSSHLICCPLVLKSWRRKDSRPAWISTVLAPILNLEPSFSSVNHRFGREDCSSISAVEKGGWGKLPVGFLSRAWAASLLVQSRCCVRGPCPGGQGSSVPGKAYQLPVSHCSHFNTLHQMLKRITI